MSNTVEAQNKTKSSPEAGGPAADPTPDQTDSSADWPDTDRLAPVRAKRQPVSLWVLSAMALAVGTVTGLGAVFFRILISGIHNLAYHGTLAVTLDSTEFEPISPLGAGIILIPVIGGLIVIYLVRNFAPEARGHGVPEVIDAVYFKQGKIRPVVAVIKSLASALSIGTGASVGREGPIIQIGAALGSTLAQWTNLPTAQRIALLSAGAGAGIAATFNTPLGAVMFAVELMLPEISVSTFIPVVIATGTATYVGRLFFGLQPAFLVPVAQNPGTDPASLEGLVLMAVLGALCGVAAWGFIRALVETDKLFKRIPLNEYVRGAIGMSMVGVLLFSLQSGFGHTFVGGTGYETIQAVLQGTMSAAPLLLLLFVAKLFATSVSLGAGASGGVFAPSLFLGTTLGGAFGAAVQAVSPEAGITPVEGAIVGMASVNAGATGAALTAIIMVFEMTRDYTIIVPVILAVALSVGVRMLFMSETIYTVKLLPRGHRIPKDRHTNMFMIHPARDVLTGPPLVVNGRDTAEQAAEKLPVSVIRRPAVVVVDNRVAGVIADVADVLCLARRHPDWTVRRLVSRRYIVAHEDTVLHDVLKRMNRKHAETVLVVRRHRGVPRIEDVQGVINKAHIADSVLSSIQNTD